MNITQHILIQAGQPKSGVNVLVSGQKPDVLAVYSSSGSCRLFEDGWGLDRCLLGACEPMARRHAGFSS